MLPSRLSVCSPGNGDVRLYGVLFAPQPWYQSQSARFAQGRKRFFSDTSQFAGDVLGTPTPRAKEGGSGGPWPAGSPLCLCPKPPAQRRPLAVCSRVSGLRGSEAPCLGRSDPCLDWRQYHPEQPFVSLRPQENKRPGNTGWAPGGGRTAQGMKPALKALITHTPASVPITSPPAPPQALLSLASELKSVPSDTSITSPACFFLIAICMKCLSPSSYFQSACVFHLRSVL